MKYLLVIIALFFLSCGDELTEIEYNNFTTKPCNCEFVIYVQGIEASRSEWCYSSEDELIKRVFYTGKDGETIRVRTVIECEQ